MLLNIPSKAQNTFDWNDEIFEVGSQRIIHFDFDYEGICSTKPCYHFRDNGLKYDTLTNFLKENPEIKILIRYVSGKGSNLKYLQKKSESRTRGLKTELIQINGLNQQIEFGAFQMSDTLSLTSGYEITIMETELSQHIKQTLSDTTLTDFYNQQFDYFKLKPDTINNKALDKLGFYLEKLLQNDTSLVIDIVSIDNDSRAYIYSEYDKIIIEYLIRNFDIEANKFKKVCTIKPYFIGNDNHVVIIKIVMEKDYEKCVEERKKDKCENCPF